MAVSGQCVATHTTRDLSPSNRTVRLEEYVYLVPCLEMEDDVVLKTIIPSRKLTKQYSRKGSDNE